MSTTYTAKGTYNDANLSDEDKALIDSYKKMWADANAAGDDAGKNAAHKAAEEVRKKYNYSGGDDGSEWIYVRPETTVSYNDNSDYLEQMYTAKKQAGLAALKAAYDKNVASLDATATKIPGVYTNAKNQTAANAAQAQRNFNQQAVAAGLSSGASAQATLANSVTLQGNLNSINQAEADAKAELELQRANLATEYENAIAQANANGNYELAAALYEEKVRVDEYIAAQEAAAVKADQQAYDNGKATAEYLYKTTGNASRLKDYGYTDEEIAQLEAKWIADNTPKADYSDADYLYKTTGDASGYVGRYTPEQIAAMEEQWKINNTPGTSDVTAEKGLQLAQYLYQTTGDASLFAQYGYTPEQIANMQTEWKRSAGLLDNITPTPEPEPTEVTPVYSDRDFVTIQNVVSSYLQQRDNEGLLAYLEPLIPNFTESQVNKMNKILSAYGWE